MTRQIIVAYVPADKRYKNKILKWGNTGKLGERVAVVPLDDDRFYREDGSLDRDQLAWTLKEAALVVVLVGENCEDHPWLEWEGEFCHQWGINRVLMRIPYTECWLPEPYTVLREIAYNPNAIEKEVKKTVEDNIY